MLKKKKSRAEKLFKLRHFVRILPIHFLVMGSVFIVATIFNKYIEAVCFLTAFFLLRYTFPKTFHSDSLVVCMTFTITMFSLSIIICPPIYMYFFVSILFALFDSFLLWAIKDRKDLIEYKKYSESFKLETATKEQIIERCKILKYDKDKTELALKFFVERLSNKQVYEYLCKNNLYLDYDTVITYKYRMSKALKQFEK